jgi:hypothetical protein
MKRFFSFTALAIAGLALFAACGADIPGAGDNGGGGSADTGKFAGQITIGPVCPVEPCDFPEGAIYQGRDLTFLRSGASTFNGTLNVLTTSSGWKVVPTLGARSSRSSKPSSLVRP